MEKISELFIKIASKINSDKKKSLTVEEATEEFKSKLEKIMNEFVKSIKPKEKKDKNAPKSPSNPYIIFSREKRSSLQDKYPDMGPKGITQKLGEMWKEMSEEDKEKYVKDAEQDKERYKEEMTKYREESKTDDISNISTIENDKKLKKTKKEKLNNEDSDKKEKRPLSSYMMFTQAKREEVKEKNPGIKPTEISKVLGKMWKEMGEDEKNVYKNK